MKHTKRLAAVLAVTTLVVCAAALASSGKKSGEVPNQERIAQLISRNLPRMHMSHKPFDDQVAQDALDLYLDQLDYDHSYFLQSDVDEFRLEADELDNRLREGDVGMAYRIYDVLKERVSNRVEFAQTLLDNGFNLDADETYRWKRKDEPWPDGQEAWDELWRKKIKNQYLARRVSQTLASNDMGGAEADSEDTAETAGDDAGLPDANLSPEAFVLKSYEQYMTVLNDNDNEWALEQYMTAFARAYDPHTDYMSKSNTEDFDIGMRLSLVGIGALLSTEDGAAKIEKLIAGGPAENDGRLKAGDKIIAVAQDDEEAVDVLHWPLRKTVRLIRGEKGTRVVLTVIRGSDPTGGTIERIDLIRDEVKLEEQAAKKEVREFKDTDGATRKYGIITLPEFYADISGKREEGREPRKSSSDVKNLLEELKKDEVAGVVLDLRNNGGGLLSEAIEMTGLFIDSGPVVQVYNRQSTRVLPDDDPDITYDGPLVVLVSRQTASASEILAGALQDYGRAVIIGDSKTHGKGTVQTLTDLRRGAPELGTMKVTTATFYRIDGGSTQLRGIVPDIIMSSALDSMEIGEEYLPHAMPWTKVYPALYRRIDDTGSVLPLLQEKSAERHQSDAQYKAYQDLLDKLAERHRTNEISLNLESRLQLASEEKNLQKLIDESGVMDPDAEASKEEKEKRDIVLTEALCVLSDLVSLTGAEDEQAITAVTQPAGIAQD